MDMTMDTIAETREAIQLMLKITRPVGSFGKYELLAAIGKVESKVKVYKETGEQSLKRLNRSKDNKQNIEISGEDIQVLRTELKQYKVDFSVTRELDSENYRLWFKGKDVETINTALKKAAKSLSEKERMEDQIRPAKEKAAEQKQERQRQKMRQQKRNQNREVER